MLTKYTEIKSGSYHQHASKITKLIGHTGYELKWVGGILRMVSEDWYAEITANSIFIKDEVLVAMILMSE